MDCVLCLTAVSGSGILVGRRIGSTVLNQYITDTKKSVVEVLGTHFGWLKDQDITDTVVCAPCWIKVLTFHKFYQTVETLHIEGLPIEEGIKPDRPVLDQAGDWLQGKQRNYIDDVKPEPGDNNCDKDGPHRSPEPYESDIDAFKSELPDEDWDTEYLDEPFETNAGTCNSIASLENVSVIECSTSPTDSENQTYEMVASLENSNPDKSATNSIENLVLPTNRPEINGRRNSKNMPKTKTNLQTSLKNTFISDKQSNFAMNKSIVPPKAQQIIKNVINSKSEYYQIKETFCMECDLCLAPFNTFHEANQHYKNIHKLDAGYLMCIPCGLKFSSFARVKEHCEWHLDPTIFSCKICSKNFLTRVAQKKHMECNHLTEELLIFHCTECDKAFSKKFLLEKHVQERHTKAEDRNFECYICKNRFVYLNKLLIHFRNKHQAGPSCICDICAKTFRSERAYAYHRDAQHNEEIKPVQCAECGKWLKHKHTLYRHMFSHRQKKQTCTVCGLVSVSSQALTSHMNKMHHEKPRHDCKQCGKSFRNKGYLKEHMAIHQNVYLHECPWCPYTSRFNSNIATHTKRIHPDERLALKQAKLDANCYNP